MGTMIFILLLLIGALIGFNVIGNKQGWIRDKQYSSMYADWAGVLNVVLGGVTGVYLVVVIGVASFPVNESAKAELIECIEVADSEVELAKCKMIYELK